MEDLGCYTKCEYCGNNIAITENQQIIPRYHIKCAWYELPCAICGKTMTVHRDWKNPPKAHKSCKDLEKAKWDSRPCKYCGNPIRFRINAVKITEYHKKCMNKLLNGGQGICPAKKSCLRVFLCHSSSDKRKVRELYKRLLSDGVKPWLDEKNLLPGQDWNFEIAKSVRDSHAVLVCLSNTSISKAGYVQKEIRYALDVADEQPEGTIYLIPLKLEECSVPSRLSRWHWVNLFEQDGYSKLLLALQERARSIGIIICDNKTRHSNDNHERNAIIADFLLKLSEFKNGILGHDFFEHVNKDYSFKLWDPAAPTEGYIEVENNLIEKGLINLDDGKISISNVGKEFIERFQK